MRIKSIWYGTPLLAALAVWSVSGLAQRSGAPAATQAATPAATTARIVAAAQEVVKTLDDAGRSKVQFPFDGPQKARWSNLPSGIFKREGLRLGDLTPPQKAAVMNLLTVALSRDGYRKVTEIMRGDEVLRTGQSGGRGRRKRRERARWRRPGLRRRRVLPRVRRHTVHGRAVDAAVRRPSPGDQSDDGGEPGEHDAEPARGSAGHLHSRRPGDSSARQGKRQGLRADQCARGVAAKPGDSHVPRVGPRAGPRPGRPRHSA